MKLTILYIFIGLVTFSSQEENLNNLHENDLKSANRECSLSMFRDFGSPQPLYIRPGTSKFFHPNDRRGLIIMNTGDRMEMFCEKFVLPAGFSGLISIECVSGTSFRHNGLIYNFKHIQCSKNPQPVNVLKPFRKCFNRAQVIDIGFQAGSRFIPILKSCHDPVLNTNYYTSYQLTPSNVFMQPDVGSITWEQHEFFSGKQVNSLMTINTQRRTVVTILNSQESADYFIRPIETEMYLARGHMAARSDFVFGPEQRATFTFVNFAPQYQSFNARNWLAVEIGTRRLAADRNITLDTFTGTHGVTHFWNEKGDRRQIFIGWPQRSIPVPKIFYKIIINRANQSGIVFIGVNNIFLTLDEIQKDYMYCEDISDRVNYINWNRSDIFLGYSYACDVNEFLRAVPHIPGLMASSLLL